MAKQELLASIQDRYRESSRKDKTRILDEFIAVTPHQRRRRSYRAAGGPAGNGGGIEETGRPGDRYPGRSAAPLPIVTTPASGRIEPFMFRFPSGRTRPLPAAKAPTPADAPRGYQNIR